MGKFVRWDVLDGRLSWSFDQDKIVAEKLFDGCYIVSGEVPKEKMAASQVVASYKKLGLVEEAFRSLKTVQLEVRPVYHKTDDRIPKTSKRWRRRSWQCANNPGPGLRLCRRSRWSWAMIHLTSGRPKLC